MYMWVWVVFLCSFLYFSLYDDKIRPFPLTTRNTKTMKVFTNITFYAYSYYAIPSLRKKNSRFASKKWRIRRDKKSFWIILSSSSSVEFIVVKIMKCSHHSNAIVIFVSIIVIIGRKIVRRRKQKEKFVLMSYGLFPLHTFYNQQKDEHFIVH